MSLAILRNSARLASGCARSHTKYGSGLGSRIGSGSGYRHATVKAMGMPIFGNRRFYSEDLDIGKYHEVADQTLEYITESYETLGEKIPEVDIDLAQGVLTLVLPPHGTYVINKQPPNKQIWLSSPLSGPKRYDLIDNKWIYHRDLSTLGSLLKKETALVTEAKNIDPIDLSELD